MFPPRRVCYHLVVLWFPTGLEVNSSLKTELELELVPTSSVQMLISMTSASLSLP